MLETIRSKIKRGMRRFARLASPGRFARHQGGSSAVEFALILVPFLALLFGIMQTALIFFADETLETAVTDSARLILTGQAQDQAFDAQKFKTAVCKHIYAMFNCDSGVYVDVQTHSSFSGITFRPPIDRNGELDTSGFSYNPGGPGDIVVVTLYYEWPIFFRLMDFNALGTPGLADGNRLLVATAAFRNEPYN